MSFDDIFKSLDDILSKRLDLLNDDLDKELKSKYGKISINSADLFAAKAKKLERELLNPKGLRESILRNKTIWVYKYQSEILNSSDASLKVAFGTVCSYDNKLGLAYKSFNSIPGNAKQIVESRGLITYEAKKYDLALKHFITTSKFDKSKFGNLAHSLTLLALGKNNLEAHKKILKSSKSDIAHRIIGTMEYNKENYIEAKEYFKTAWSLKKSEINLLNLLSAERRIEDNYAASEFVAVTNKYFLESPQVPSNEIIDEYMYKSSLDLPEFFLNKNLYKVLLSINN